MVGAALFLCLYAVLQHQVGICINLRQGGNGLERRGCSRGKDKYAGAGERGKNKETRTEKKRDGKRDKGRGT